MEIAARIDDRTIEIALPDPAAVRAFVDEAKQQGAFLLTLPEPPPTFVPLTISLRVADGIDFRFEAAAVQLFGASEGGCRATFQLEAWSPEKEQELERRLAGRPGTGEPDDESEMLGVSPITRLRKMAIPERMRLAPRADRAEKNILLRDSSPQVLLALLNNPHLGADDARAIAGSSQASAAVLERISKERRWTASSSVQKALVQNPKTPVPIALRFIELLPTEDLRKLAKMQSGLKEKLRTAALRTYLKRSERR